MTERVSLMADIDKTSQVNAAQPLVVVAIDRPAFTQSEFDAAFSAVDSDATAGEAVARWFKKKCQRPTARCLGDQVLGFFPFIGMLRTYAWRSDFVTDAVSGLCCGVTHVPMGIAFTFLAAVPPVYGIYSALFPVMAYFFIGGSRHISIHTMALTALMVGAVVDREVLLYKLESADNIDDDSTLDVTARSENASVLHQLLVPSPSMTSPGNRTVTHAELAAFSVEIAASVTLMAGAFQILMSVLRMGVIGTYMSVPYVNGFLLGACCHIILSQVPLVLGLRVERVTGVGELPIKVAKILTQLGHCNIATVVNGLCCLIFLVFIKEVINIKYSHKLKIPIPAEIVVVAICSTISYLAKLHQRFGIATVATVPMGLPVPRLPAMTNASNYVIDAILLAVISYVISLSLAKSFARKYKYQIDPNREMLTYGISNSVGGLFSCFAGAAAPPICCVQETTRGSSQMVSLVSSLFVLLVCLAAGPLIEPLPSSSLGAIVIVALLPVFKRLAELKLLWRLNRWDVAVWMVTWLSVFFLDVTTGAGLGMIFNLIVLTLQHQMLGGQRQANAKDTEIYVAGSRYKSVTVPDGIGIFYFSSNLVYVNADRFKNDLFKMIDREADVVNIDVLQLIGAPCVDLEYDVSSPLSDAGTNNVHLSTPQSAAHGGDHVNGDKMQSADCNPNVINCVNTSSDKLKNQMDLKRVHFKNEINEKLNMSNGNGVHNSTSNGNGVLKAALNSSESLENQKKIMTELEYENLQSKISAKKELEAFNNGSSKCIRSIIVDCSAVGFLDIVGLNVLTQVNGLLVGQGRRMVLAQCTPGLLRQLTAAEDSGAKFVVYPTVHDAVVMETVLDR